MEDVVVAARTGLAALADPDKAPAMQRYMKSEMPFLGVPTPSRRGLARQVFAAYPVSDAQTWEDAVRELWFGARYREERYLALDLMQHRPYRNWHTAAHLALYEELIVSGAWWDLVDEIAIRRIGPILRAEPEAVGPALRIWAADSNPWKRRAAIICQVGATTRTDTALLAHGIEANVADKDFFLRKGIGWALRDYARTDPQWVQAFVDAHPNLSPLSRREALKHVAPRE